MKAILIDGDSHKIYELEMAPSHWAMEEEIGTRFWVMRRLGTAGCDVLFHAEGRSNGFETFAYRGVGYSGNGLLCRVDLYGDLESTNFTVAEVEKEVVWGPMKPPSGWPCWGDTKP